MAATRGWLSSARRHLDLFEESWKADHAAAMKCREAEEWIAEAVSLFELIDQLVQLRRRRVFHGSLEVNEELDAIERTLYQRWLTLVERATPRLVALEEAFGVVEGFDRFRACHDKALAFLSNWAPAVPSMAVAQRAGELTKEEADELRELHNNPQKGGRPKWEPQSLPTGDASLLR